MLMWQIEHQRLHLGETGEQNMNHVLSTPQQNYDTPASLPNKGLENYGFKYRLWEIIRWFRRDDKRFAIKVGVGAAIYVSDL
jgi:hypothetical protein